MTRHASSKRTEGKISPIRSENAAAAGIIDDDVFPGPLGFAPRTKDFRAVVLPGQDEADEAKEGQAEKEIIHREGMR